MIYTYLNNKLVKSTEKKYIINKLNEHFYSIFVTKMTKIRMIKQSRRIKIPNVQIQFNGENKVPKDNSNNNKIFSL